MGGRPRTCVTCGKHDSIVGTISWGQNCRACGQRNLTENIIGIATKSGPAWRRRARGIEAYVARIRLDMERDSA